MNSLDEIWMKECTLLDQMFDQGVSLDATQRMQFHDYVFHHCSSFLHNTILSARAQDAGKHFYGYLTSYLTTRLKEMSTDMETIAEDMELLVVYAQKWQSYQKACTELNFICHYFNAYWVKLERQGGHSNIYEIYPMTLQLWKNLVFSPIDRSLTDAIRRQKKNDGDLVFQVLQSIVQLYAHDAFQQTTVRNKLINVFGLKSGVLEFYTIRSTALFEKILENKGYTDLKAFLKYACLAMPEIEEGEKFKEMLKKHIEWQLVDAIKKSLGGKDYVQAILGMRHGPVARALLEHKKLHNLIDHVCDKAVNSSEINKKMTSVEVLVRYSHQLLTTKHPSDKELSAELKRIVEVVQFLNDKDKFLDFYRRSLHNRQIMETSTSDDMEETMISHLKSRFGDRATKNLFMQLMEVQKSNIISDQFNTYLGVINLGFDFRIKCYKDFMYNKNTPRINLILPLELQHSVELFNTFFAHTYTARKYKLSIELSTAEIIVNINQRSPYFVNVSMFQMVLLLQFNQNDKYTVEELALRLGTEEETLIPVLGSCIKAQILVCDELLTSSAVVEVAKEFANRKRHLNINRVPTKQRKVEPEYDDADLMKNRPFQVRAAAARIMKKRMTLHHSQLVVEIIEELKNLFKPDTRLIKREIDYLIEKDFIKRDDINSKMYIYMN